MFKINKKIEYAMLALLEIENLPEGDSINVKTLVEKAGLPKALIGKILQSLNREGILESTQGVKGGYRLNRDFEHIKLKDLIEAVDGPIAIVDCFQLNNNCENSASCELKTPFSKIQDQMVRFFMEITMAEIKGDQNFKSIDSRLIMTTEVQTVANEILK